MEALQQAGAQYSIHIKSADRPPREYDGVEIRCVERISTPEWDYIYQTYGWKYGIQRSQIDAALSANRHHFIICNDIHVIRALRRDYDRRVRVVFHLFDAPKDTIESIQRNRHITDDEIALRLAKIEGLYRSFLNNQELFDGVVINRFSDNPDAMLGQVETQLSRFVVESSPSSFSGDALKRVAQEIHSYLSTSATPAHQPIDRGYCFIMMAMIDKDPMLEDTHDAIRRACAGLGFRGERIDDRQFTGQITEKVLNSIRIAEYVIADLTHERPNVYYEIGFADALGKPIILTARDGTKVHFDLQGHRVLYYKT